MLHALIALLFLVAPATAQEKKAPPPDPKVIEATVEELETALKAGGTPEKVAAIQKARAVVDIEVVQAIVKGLRDKETEVKAAVLDALRWMDHPAALDALTSTYKKDKELRKVPELYEMIVKGLAQHGKEESIDLLTDFSLKGLTHKVIRARILGLGMIRSPRSIDGAFAIMSKFGRHKVQPYMGDLRMTLVVLVGDDHGGESQDVWLRWWNENKKTLAVSPTVPELPDRLRQEWRRYWDLPYEKERAEKRDERGGGSE